jgi:hypothetical protein
MVQNYQMWVGGKFYSRESYITEAKKMGASKKVAYVPHGLVVGESKIYLISDMTEAQKKAYQDEIRKRNRISHAVAAEANRKLKEGEEPVRPIRTGFGSLPRGEPVVFGYFIIRNIVYVVAPGMDVPKALSERGVNAYVMEVGDFGSNDERGCGSLKIGATYLLSEEDMEKVKDLASSAQLESTNIHIFDTPIPYVGKRFRGIQETRMDVIV